MSDEPEENEPAARRAMRVALSAFPERYVLPVRPSAAPPSVQDAFRQTQFLLGEDLLLFEKWQNLQLRVVAENAKLRTAPAACLLAFWSRVFSHLADACALMVAASYVSCPPLLRTACDCLAAERALLRDGFGEYEEWLADAVSQDREHAALAFDLGRYRAGSALAEDPRLGALYRLLTDLSMPHFGATALMVAPDSNLQKLSLAFADSAFHLAWTQLVTGWLLLLAQAQTDVVMSSSVFQAPDAARADAEALTRDTGAALADPRRCRVEEADGRFLFHNFRRAAAGAPRRIVI